MNTYKRNKRVSKFFVILLRPFLKWKFNFSYDSLSFGNGPCIILANHNTDYDPIFMSVLSKDFMYFVASEHVFRQGIWSKLLVWAFDPIPRTKADGGVLTVIKMMRRLKKGQSVCIFAEGNRSFHGKTMPILPATGAFVKRSGAKLITYKFKGGYFSQPRWGASLRKGKLTGHFVNEYSTETLAEMSVDEINKAIAEDLFEDSYETQKEQKIKYKGKRLAEKLESLLFFCPACKNFGRLQTEDNIIKCECEFYAKYNEYGYLENSQDITNIETITKWNELQKNHLEKILFEEENNTQEIFSDDNVELKKIDKHHRIIEEHKGSITAKKDSLIIADKTFLIKDIIDMALYGRNNIVFSLKNEYYEVKSCKEFCGWKYFLIFDIIKNKQTI